MSRRKDYHLCIFIIVLQLIFNILAQQEEKVTPGSESLSSVTTDSTVSSTQQDANKTQSINSTVSLPSTTNTTDSPTTASTSQATNTSGINNSASTNDNTSESPTVEADNDTNTTPLSNTLSIFFVNDLQYDIFPVNSDDGIICDVENNVTECVGGVGRLSSYIKTKMKNDPNSLWLNVGNTLGGEWFKILKYKTALEAIKFLNFTFMTIGPDVFEYGEDASEEFLEELSKIVIISNMNNSNIMKSGLYSIGMCNVSVIGFLDDAIENGIAVKNVTEAIAQEINETRSKQNSSSHIITIALGSTTRVKANIIANTTDGIDVILYSGNCTPTETEDNTTEYFCWDQVNKTDNKMTYVYSLGIDHSDMAARFLVGELQMTLGNSCNIESIKYNYYDYSNETDDPWISNLTQIAGLADLDKALTENTKNLSGDSQLCNDAECSLGNLITDAMLAALGHNMWSDDAARLAVFPSTMLQENKSLPQGEMTAAQMYDLVSRDAYIYTIALTSLQLHQMLNISLNSKKQTNSTDFLHVSSLLNVKYNRSADNTINIISINTVLASSDSMSLQAINMTDNETLYSIIVPYTLFKMDSYRQLLDTVNDSRITYHNVTVIEAVIKTINNTGFVPLPIVGNRQQELDPIVIKPLPDCPSSTGTTILVTLVVTAVLLGGCYGIWWYIFKRRRGRSDSSLTMLNLEYGSR